MYTQEIINRFKKPAHTGLVKNADAVGHAQHEECGDIIKIYLKVENGKIVDAKFKTFGGVATIVASDVAVELVLDKTLEEASKITAKQILKNMGEIPEEKTYCAELARLAIEDAMLDYEKRQLKEAAKHANE